MSKRQFTLNVAQTIAVIGILFTLFWALYVLGGMTIEKFSQIKFPEEAALLPTDKVFVYQGSQMPDSKAGAISIDQGDTSVNTVDGKRGSPKSMFMFSYNKCDPKCCDYSPYSCSGGCVCMTPDQVNFIGSRGKNNQADACTRDTNVF